jgi:uncharacterized protein YndB with AHSA1/START domain
MIAPYSPLMKEGSMSTHTTTSTVTIQAPVAQVWAAVTRPDLVKQWQYGSDLITDWQTGSSIVFRNEWDSGVYEQTGTILEVDAPRLVRYSLFAPSPAVEDRPENYFTMTYVLSEADGATTLTIIQDDPRGPSPQEEPDENAYNALDALKQLVESQQHP